MYASLHLLGCWLLKNDELTEEIHAYEVSKILLAESLSDKNEMLTKQENIFVMKDDEILALKQKIEDQRTDVAEAHLVEKKLKIQSKNTKNIMEKIVIQLSTIKSEI